MSNLSEKDKKFLEKQIAKKVRDELDKEDFEDTAWLKAFTEAKGKKDQAKVFYIDIRSQDLWDSEIEDFEAEVTANAKKIRDAQIKTDKDEYFRKGKLEFFNKRQEIDYLTQKESNEYRAARKRYLDYEKSPDPNEITQHNLDRHGRHRETLFVAVHARRCSVFRRSRHGRLRRGNSGIRLPLHP